MKSIAQLAFLSPKFAPGLSLPASPKGGRISNSFPRRQLTLDPWAASSLLQKSIRRGEVKLALRAAATLHQYRGHGIWRRLASIALEDVGIADLQLVSELVRLSTDAARQNVETSPHVLADVVRRLAAAPKDRSADYLFCAATKLATALDDRRAFEGLSFDEKLSIATHDFEPLTRRAVATLSACTTYKGGKLLVQKEASRTFVAGFERVPDNLLNSMMLLTGQHSHPFGLMLVLVWSQYEFTGGASGYSRPPLPQTEHINGLPLYTFDKHTAVGKKTIPKLAEQCPSVRDALARWVPRDRWAEVTLMAAFYVDAAPVAHRLEWFASELLEFAGFHADMTSAGCVWAGAKPVMECVEDSLAVLNHLRRAALI